MRNTSVFRIIGIVLITIVFAHFVVPVFAAEKDAGYRLPPEKYEKAIRYAKIRYALYFISVAYGLLILWGFLRFRVAPGFRDWAEQISAKRLIRLCIFVTLFVLTLTVFNIPLDVYGHSLRLKYDLSVQSWGSWMWDWTKAQFIGLLVTTFVVWVLYAIIRLSPRRWWFYFWLACLPLIVFMVFISPVLIDPLFYKFEPLDRTQPQLVGEIEKVVKRGTLDIPRNRMFEMNASTKSKTVNAYVTGFGASKRVVVWDTTIQKMTTSQTLIVFGHEMGHYVLHHIPKTIAFLSVGLFIFLFVGSRVMQWALQKWGSDWRIRNLEDYASLPVLLLFLSIFSFFATPIISTYSRSNEHDADIYGLEVVYGIVPNSQEVAAESFQILGEMNLSDPHPHPFIKLWLYSHPPLNERLIFAREYDPRTSKFINNH